MRGVVPPAVDVRAPWTDTKQHSAVRTLRCSTRGVQAEVALDYLGRAEVRLVLALNRVDPEVAEAMKPLEALLIKRAKAAVAHLEDTT